MSQPALTIASLLTDPSLKQACHRWLRGGRYRLEYLGATPDPVRELERRCDSFDVVLLQQGAFPGEAYGELVAQGLLLPAVVIGEVNGRTDYHEAEVHLPPDQLEQLSYSVDAAVSRFLRRGLSSAPPAPASVPSPALAPQAGWGLPSRIKDRLGYLGVFYKRDPSLFLRNLPEQEREDLLASLERTYRDLLLSYFRDPAAANQAIESFVHTAFFSDLPITKAVEIHMNLIDDFSKQLRLEGHKSDFLQDYRLALIDVMAHLCEMYRRSVPPDLPVGAAIAEASTPMDSASSWG
ncbi:circadian clock protein KaiA [Vulcanococcus limneticus]|uniref:circadian clock protein KaiA n=1 Tax=Vulcanococcus limneticus TaxID=2170428 RepID=UPI000B988A06|nr:circadian clock protein KaiA [Vulcanococcus limneticus]MCP9790357.1 circadian clock protein KaiA [Vulcanococcus limneticus MW73D5]MCP9892422.1 circadian clock protein KaiA [Vulcanococcus limneticus Candia 3F8]MCP9895756.1 circadian clock protein KaiA [Vulcanococcus limneticus Candia 3B3]